MNEPEPGFTYDIPLEELRRYRELPPREILRWLQEVNELAWKAKQARWVSPPRVKPDA